MESTHFELPQDVTSCHALILELLVAREQDAQQIAARDQIIAEKDQIIAEKDQAIIEYQETVDRLSADTALLKRALFGSRRERFIEDPAQGLLFDFVELDSQSTEPTAAMPLSDQPKPPQRRTSKGRARRVFPEFLPRTFVRHELREEDIPDDLKNDPTAKRFFKTTSEQVEYEPPKLTVIVHLQEVIVRDEPTGETTIITAQKPPQIIESYAGPALLAFLTASRFADHMPYYRLEDIFSRIGFRIGRSTQWRWMFGLAEAALRLVDLLRWRALQSFVLGVDETPVRTLSLPVDNVKAYLWGIYGDRNHPFDAFYFTVERSRAGPEKFLSQFHGYLQSDAYICYERIALDHEEIIKVACWAHARRKFHEVHITGPTSRTHTAMGYFQRLYDIEDRARLLSDAQRHELRQRESLPIVTAFHDWLVEHHERELPKSKLRAAIGYMLNRWDAFARYLEHGAIPIDNNRTEASLKYPILGRNAWLFFGNETGGQAAAALFTLTRNCNRHHIDPFAYLRDVYQRLPTITESRLEELLPDRWIQDHPEHLIQPRIDEAAQRAERTRQRRQARRMASIN